jgi:transposase-like protein|nr:MAG TPA: hypothetical protein [Caudoviricetes sp.]
MNTTVKSLNAVLKELEKSRERFRKKGEKERIKLKEVYVTVKGEQIHTDRELWELFEADVINGNQYDNYRDKLEEKRKRAGEINNKTTSELSVQILNNIIKNLKDEIKEEEDD